MIGRVLRALRLDASLYEEVEAREDLDREAWTVVGLFAAVSAVIGLLVVGFSEGFGYGFGTAIILVIVMFISYIVSAASIWFVGAKMFGGMADFGETAKLTMLPTKFFCENLRNDFGVCSTSGFLHHLAGEKTAGLFTFFAACFNILDSFRIGGYYFIDNGLEFAGIAFLNKVMFFGNVPGIYIGIKA